MEEAEAEAEAEAEVDEDEDFLSCPADFRQTETLPEKKSSVEKRDEH